MREKLHLIDEIEGGLHRTLRYYSLSWSTGTNKTGKEIFFRQEKRVGTAPINRQGLAAHFTIAG